MARTDAVRFTEAVAYLRGISAALANDITMQAGGRGDQLGASISLEGAGFWKAGHGNKAQHAAVRALMLCQRVYLTPPYTTFKLSSDIDIVKTTFHVKSEEQIKQAILCYLPTANPTLEGFAKAAEAIKNPVGAFNWETRTRTDQSLGPNPVCFNAVKLWLFNSGFVSLRWMASKGQAIDANQANTHLGDGKVIRKDELLNIPRGHMFNFHDAINKAVCHWGVSLGGGWAAGSNTTPFAKNAGAEVAVNFRSGGSIYGEFTLASSAEVCKYKYGMGKEVAPEITIRQIDPSIVSTYF